MLHLTTNKLPAGTELIYRPCGKLFNLPYLQAKTNITPTSVIELQYPDDACIFAVSKDVPQATISIFTETYESMGLTLNNCKMWVLYQPGLALWSKAPIIKQGDQYCMQYSNSGLTNV
eukprot:g39315.t1